MSGLGKRVPEIMDDLLEGAKRNALNEEVAYNAGCRLLEVAEWRQRKQALAAAIAKAREALESTIEYQSLQLLEATKDVLDGEVERQETELRRHAIALHNILGDRKNMVWVGVRAMKRVEYDVAEATEWSRANAPGLLVLDKKAFEKAMKAGIFVTNDVPARVFEELTGTIKSDLSALISEPCQEEPLAKTPTTTTS